MSKKDDHTNESHTEVHVETSSEQTTGNVDERIDELTSDLKRVQAEFVNFRRRAEEEKGELMNFATSRIAREFLAIRDNFDSELKHRPADLNADWAASIDSIRHQFDKTMANLGVERFESVGQEFDPHQHEAITHEGDGHTVTEELQAGYKLGKTILRPAMVKVGDKPGHEEK